MSWLKQIAGLGDTFLPLHSLRLRLVGRYRPRISSVDGEEAVVQDQEFLRGQAASRLPRFEGVKLGMRQDRKSREDD